MDFAPYQDTAPESTRALSPPPRRSTSRSPNPKSPPPNRGTTDPFLSSTLPAPNHFSDDPRRDGRGFGNTDLESGRMDVNLFETSLPLRLDYEAMLAYLLLPPAGGVLLLVLEHKSDYVRFPAHKPRPGNPPNLLLDVDPIMVNLRLRSRLDRLLNNARIPRW
ncbi:MAG: hypothetical protein Q9196_003509 [Gyalolechia fulgens]